MSRLVDQMFLDIHAVRDAGGMDAFIVEVKAETITRAEKKIEEYAAPGGLERRALYAVSLGEVLWDRLNGDMRRIGQELIDGGTHPLEAATIAGNKIGKVEGVALERLNDWAQEVIKETADV